MNPETVGDRLRADSAVRADWEEHEGWTLPLGGRQARFILPEKPAEGSPWFWRPEFFGAFAGLDRMLLKRGWTLGFLDLPDHYGCPAAVAAFAGLHDYATGRLGLAPRVAIVALSRGGLSAYRFAATHPDKVSAIYADNPVCDFRSWPGGVGKGPGSRDNWQKLLAVYQLTHDEALAWESQPWNLLEPIVRAGIPVFHICGDSDETVPVEDNTAVLRARLRALGGDYREIIKPGGKHHPHGLDDPRPLADFFESTRSAAV